MLNRRIASGAAAGALALLASACSDRLTAPVAHPAAPSLSASAPGVQLFSNAVRYSDTGGRPATGRSGSAALDALALLGGDGWTDVELNARSADPANPATGTVARAQAKVYDAAGSVVLTRSVDGGVPLRIGGLVKGSRIGVQANVTGIDAHRTDVVSVQQTVRMRPDLAVTQAGVGNTTVYAGSPVVVGATIAELNGDLGAEADCVLLLDGQPVDEARRIWVDAGGRVSCFFSSPDLAEGAHTLTVVVDGVKPGDWDAANNSASVQVNVLPVPAPMSWGVWARSESYRVRNFWSTTQVDFGWGREDATEETEEGTLHTVQASGFLQRGFAAPAAFRVQEWSGGQPLQDDAWTREEFNSPVVCTQRYNQAVGTSLFFCSYFGSASQWQFFRLSGVVTYHSAHYYREWDQGTGDEFVWHWSYDRTMETGPAEVMRDYALRISIASRGAEPLLLTDAQMELEPFTEEYGEPDWCFEDGDPSWDFYFRTCYGGRFTSSGFAGYRTWLSDPDYVP